MRTTNSFVALVAVLCTSAACTSANADIDKSTAEAGRVHIQGKGHTARIFKVAFSPDGKTLASITGHFDHNQPDPKPGEVKLWDVATAKERATIAIPGSAAIQFSSLAFTADGNTVISAMWIIHYMEKDGFTEGGMSVQHWELATGKVGATFGARFNPFKDGECSTRDFFFTALSADGKTVAWGGAEEQDKKITGTAHVWEVESLDTSPPKLPKDADDKAAENQPVAAEDQAIAAIQKIGGDYEKLAGVPYVTFTRNDKALGKPVIGITLATAQGARWKEVTDAVCPEIAKFKSLQTLDLGVTQVTDAGMAQLQGLSNLKSLSLPVSATDKSMAVVGRFSNLETLHISQNRITEKGIAELKQLKNLKTLTLSNLDANNSGGIVDALIHGGPAHTNNFTDRGLAHLAELPSLESLDISGNPRITGTGLAGFKSLKAVTLNGNGLTDAGLKSVARLTTLQSLNLNLSGNKGITDAGIAELKSLQHLLPSLDLSDTRVTDAGLKELAALQGLQALNLNHTSIGDDGLAELKRLPALKSIELQSTNITDAGAKHLSEFPALESVDLWGTLVTEVGLHELPHLKRLLAPVGGAPQLGLKEIQFTESLTLGGGQITDRWLKQLKAFSSLRSLSLDSAGMMNDRGTGFTGVGLGELKGLTSLSLHRCPRFTDANMPELSQLKELRVLDLGFTGWQSDTAGNPATISHPWFGQVDPGKLGVSDAGLAHLKQLENLQHLDLNGTQITDAGLAELKTLKNLQKLLIGYNEKMTGTGLAELKDLKNLQHLDLIHCGITDDGAKRLAKLQSLKTIDLRGTKITDAGLKELKSLLNLKELNLCLVPGGPFDVTREGINELRAALPEAKILR